MSQIIEPLKKTAKELFAIPRIGAHIEQEIIASVFGMVESGKTTILGLLEIISINLANETNKPGSKTKFHYLVLERSSGIRQTAGELRQGIFPPKTPPGHTFEADFLMRWGSTIGEKQIKLPFCETAGETFTEMLERFGKGQYEIDPMMEDSDLIYDYVLKTDAIILIAPVTRPLGLEREIGAPLNLPDVNMARLVSGILGYKMEDAKNNLSYRPIRGIGVFLTKIDGAEKLLGSKHINLNTKDGIHTFMSRYFPETYATLSWYGLKNVKFWTTGLTLEVEKDPNTGRAVPKIHPESVNRVTHDGKSDRSFKIKVDYNRNMPEGDRYEESMLDFIDWLKNTVMA